MSSLPELDSSFARSATVDSTTSTLSHDKKKWRSPIWQYCRHPILDEDQTHLYCTQCPSDPTHEDYNNGPFHGNHAENMKKHLKRHYSIVLKKALSKNQAEVNHQLRQLYYQAEATSHTDELDAKILHAQLNRDVIIEALITLIVVRNLSFCLAEWPEFHTLYQALNPEYEGVIAISHPTIAARVSEAWTRHKDVVRRVLQGALTRIHISLDMWTSPNHLLLLAVVAHFTTQDLKK
jgi:hypothetical protein